MSNSGLISAYEEDVFIVLLHQIFFTGIFFQQGWIGPQLIELLAGSHDLLLVVALTLFQFPQLLSFAEVAVNEVSAIEEQDPDGKPGGGQQVLVL